MIADHEALPGDPAGFVKVCLNEHSMFNEVSEEKQLIMTTHSAEIVRHAKVEELLLLNRDNKGFSIISHPSENEEVKIFLENELGLDELFVQNIWG